VHLDAAAGAGLHHGPAVLREEVPAWPREEKFTGLTQNFAS
jgi:hypothetical protein